MQHSTQEDLAAAGGFQYELQNWAEGGTPMFVTEFDSVSAMAGFRDIGSADDSWHCGSFPDVKGMDASDEAVRTGVAPAEVFAKYLELRERMEAHVQELSALMPSAKRTRRYGIEGSPVPDGWLRQLIHPFR